MQKGLQKFRHKINYKEVYNVGQLLPFLFCIANCQLDASIFVEISTDESFVLLRKRSLKVKNVRVVILKLVFPT